MAKAPPPRPKRKSSKDRDSTAAHAQVRPSRSIGVRDSKPGQARPKNTPDRKPRDNQSRRLPAAAPVTAPGPVEDEDGAWNTKLFHCFQDIPSCVWTLFMPCIAFGQIAEILDEGQPRCMCHALMYIVRTATAYTPCFMSFRYRTKLRQKFRLPEEPCNDFCVHLLCELCALAQEYRELTLRGIDPAEGWEGYRKSLEAPQAIEMER